MTKFRLFAGALVTTMTLSGCLSEPGRAVTAAEYGDEWPFSVPSGRVDCRPSGSAVFVADGTTYALTGLAQSRGYADVGPIWLDNPKIPGTKVSLGAITKDALELCH